MLNKILWEMVLRIDPCARVHDEDDPGSVFLPDREAAGLFGDGRKRPDTYVRMERWGECYSLNCPACGDTRGRLYICHRYGTTARLGGRTVRFGRQGMIHCHNEECQSNAFHRDAFWKWLGRELVLPRHYASRAVAADAAPRELDAVSLHILADMGLPEPRHMLLSDETPPEALGYLRKRGFDPQHLQSEYNVFWVPRGAAYTNAAGEPREMYEDRILVPVWQHNRCVYWQARDIKGRSRMKYINPGASKSALLYNADHAMLYPNICIFEGMTNVWRFGRASVALCGKGLSHDQKAIMKTLWGYDGLAVVCLDEDTYTPDARGVVQNTDLKRARELLTDRVFPRGVAVLRLRNGDAAEHDEKRLWHLFGLAVEKAVLDPALVDEAILDERFAGETPEDVQPPAVNSLVESTVTLEIEDNDGLDGDWETVETYMARVAGELGCDKLDME